MIPNDGCVAQSHTDTETDTVKQKYLKYPTHWQKIHNKKQQKHIHILGVLTHIRVREVCIKKRKYPASKQICWLSEENQDKKTTFPRAPTTHNVVRTTNPTHSPNEDRLGALGIYMASYRTHRVTELPSPRRRARAADAAQAEQPGFEETTGAKIVVLSLALVTVPCAREELCEEDT